MEAVDAANTQVVMHGKEVNDQWPSVQCEMHMLSLDLFNSAVWVWIVNRKR